MWSTLLTPDLIAAAAALLIAILAAAKGWFERLAKPPASPPPAPVAAGPTLADIEAVILDVRDRTIRIEAILGERR